MPTSFVSFLEAQKGLIGNNIRKNIQIDADIFDGLPLYSGLKPYIASFEVAMNVKQLTEWWDEVVGTGIADLFDKEGKVQVALKTLLQETIQYEQKDVGIKIELDDIDKQKKILLDAYIAYILQMLALHYVNNEHCKLGIAVSEKNTIPEIRNKAFFIEACQDKPPIPAIVLVKQEEQEKHRQKSSPKKSGSSSSHKKTPSKNSPRKKVQSQSRQIEEQAPEQQPLQAKQAPKQQLLQVEQAFEQQPLQTAQVPEQQPQQVEQAFGQQPLQAAQAHEQQPLQVEQVPEQQLQQAEQTPEQQQRTYLVEACKTYQAHLLKEIEKHYPRTGSTLHYAVTPQENRLPYKITFIEPAQRDRADAAIKKAIEKYHLVVDIRAELHKPNVAVFDQVNNFAQKLNNADNLALLNKNRDSGVAKFFKAVGFLISMFISKAHTGTFAFWKSHGRVFTERLKADMPPPGPRAA